MSATEIVIPLWGVLCLNVGIALGRWQANRKQRGNR